MAKSSGFGIYCLGAAVFGLHFGGLVVQRGGFKGLSLKGLGM